MARPPFSLAGVEYPLEHLRGFRVVVPAKDPLVAPVVLQVTFSCHVFSEKWQVHFDADRRLEEDGEHRAFCPARYGCSISLPQIINAHINANEPAYERKDSKGRKNFLFYGDADGIQYPIFFRLGRSTKIRGASGIMRIVSAYQCPGLPPVGELKPVNFAALVERKCIPIGAGAQNNSPSV
jgi:hypothetical protein